MFPSPAAETVFLRKYVYNRPEDVQNSSEEQNLELGRSNSASRLRRVAKIDILQNPSEKPTFSWFRTVRQTLRPPTNQRSAGRICLTFPTENANSVQPSRRCSRRRAGACDFPYKYKYNPDGWPDRPYFPETLRKYKRSSQQVDTAYDFPALLSSCRGGMGEAQGDPLRHP